MKILLIDPACGIAGDMLCGALLDMIPNTASFHQQMNSFDLNDYKVSSNKVLKNNISATKYNVKYKKTHVHRSLSTIVDIINKSSFSKKVKKNALKVFTHLGEAESKIHQTTLEKVHFHEVGAIDAIMDIVGICLALEILEVDSIICKTISLGGGTCNTEHGIMTVPAPATELLLHNLPVISGPLDYELTTPTGAAVLKALCSSYNTQVHGSIIASGYGAGTLDFPDRANVVKVSLFQTTQKVIDTFDQDKIAVIEADIDDMTGESLGHTINLLLQNKALDALYRPCIMKDNRPAVSLQVICHEHDLDKLCNLILQQTSTFGVRYSIKNRYKLFKAMKKVTTKWGDVAIKVGKINNKVIKLAPEFKDCQKLSKKSNIAVSIIFNEALAIANKKFLT